jgi:hypothetical protein
MRSSTQRHHSAAAGGDFCRCRKICVAGSGCDGQPTCGSSSSPHRETLKCLPDAARVLREPVCAAVVMRADAYSMAAVSVLIVGTLNA